MNYRSLDEIDKTLVEQWLSNDPEHQSADSRLFTESKAGISQFVVEREGKPVFYVSVENVARVHIQFNPSGSVLNNVRSLITSFQWLIESLTNRGYHEVIFDSRYPSLIKFCKKILGFQKLDQDYSVRL